MSKKIKIFLIFGLIILITLAIFLTKNKNSEVNSIDSNDGDSIDSKNYGEQKTSRDNIHNSVIVARNSGGIVTMTLEAVDFNVEFPEHQLPKAKVNAGDTVKMKLSFLSSEDVNSAKLHPNLYLYERGSVSEEITSGLPFEISDVKKLQNYEYEFTLTIPYSPINAQYEFGIVMSGCSSGGCGSSVGMNFEVGEGLNPQDYEPAPGETQTVVAE